MGLRYVSGFIQIVRFKKEQGHYGPRFSRVNRGVRRTAACAFWRKDMGHELMAGIVLTASPSCCFFRPALLVKLCERGRSLTENDDEWIHKGRWFTIHIPTLSARTVPRIVKIRRFSAARLCEKMLRARLRWPAGNRE